MPQRLRSPQRPAIIAVLLLAAILVCATIAGLSPFSPATFRHATVIAILRPQVIDNKTTWVIAEMLKGGESARPLMENEIRRDFLPSPDTGSRRLDGLVCLFEPRYIWFGSPVFRSAIAVYDDHISGTELTLAQLRQLNAGD